MRKTVIAVVVLALATPALAANDVPIPKTAPTAEAPATPMVEPPAAPVAGAPPVPHLAPQQMYPASPLNDPLLARLAGEWIGRGEIRQTAAAESERVFCKITNALSADGAALSQKGRCALANQSGAIDGTITALGEGKYDGTLESMASDGPATLTGSRMGDSIVMVTQFTDAQTHQPTTSTTTIEALSEGGYRLSTERTDPRTGTLYTASEIVFSAQ
jgi:hypothetical protein